jgi:hypothetical protein
MNIEELQRDQMKYYQLKEYHPEKLKLTKINIEILIPQLCFIINYLKQKNYTLTHIFLNDFEMSDNVLFLKTMNHVVEIDSRDSYVYKEIKEKSGLSFPPKGLQDGQKASVYDTYASIGLFVYYIYFKKVMKEISEKDYGKLKGTKPYYFIRNTMSQYPCLIYF